MTISLEVQLERMDGKLEKHMGITETILKNQEETLEEIRDIVKDHSSAFVGHGEADLMHENILAIAAKDVDCKLDEFEDNIDKKYKTIGGVIAATAFLIFALFEIIPLIGG